MLYEFHGYTLDVRRRALIRNGQQIDIPPKALDLLIVLVEKAGTIVSKEELLKRVWPDTFVEEANLAQNISLARKALNDNASSRVIVNVPRRGYQLAVPVRCIRAASERTAFHEYLRSRHYWNRRNRDGLARGLQLANDAIDAEPTYVDAWIGLADAYNLLGAQHAALASSESFPRARAAAQRALELDPRHGEAYASLAFVAFWYDWDTSAAMELFRKSLELAPRYASGYQWFGESLAIIGHLRESIEMLGRAVELDPLSSAIRADYATAHSLAGNYEECRRYASDILRFDSRFTRAVKVLAFNSERQRDFTRARDYADAALATEPNAADLLALKARCAAASSAQSDAEHVADVLDELAQREFVPASERASARAALGDMRTSARLLAEAKATRESQLMWMHGDVIYTSLAVAKPAKWRNEIANRVS